MRIVTLSDTHTFGERIPVPDGDVLVHCGDHTFRGTESEMIAAFRWLDSLPHKHKIAIAGNHDFYLDPAIPDGHPFRSWLIRRRKFKTIAEFLAQFPSITYLCDSGTEIDGVKFYGSPWQPWYWDWAFNFPANVERWGEYAVPRHDRQAAQAKWAKIPDDVNVLLTHTPPEGILDQAEDHSKLGCPELRKRIHTLLSLRLHVFGHIHESYGRVDYEMLHLDDDSKSKLTFVNAAICDLDYDPDSLHEPIIVDI